MQGARRWGDRHHSEEGSKLERGRMWAGSQGTQQQQAQQQKKAAESQSGCRQNLPVDEGLGALMGYGGSGCH